MVRCSGALGLFLLLLYIPSSTHSYGTPMQPAPSSYSSLSQNQIQNGYGTSNGFGQQQFSSFSPGKPPPEAVPAATSCYVDLKCFSCSPGYSIAQGFPFERRTPVTCEECLDLCLEKQSSPYPYCCRAVVYDFVYRSCDLFAVDGKSSPQVVTKYETRSYFVPTGQCTKGAQPGEEKPGVAEEEGASVCPEGKLPKFIEVSGYTDSAFHEEQTLDGYNAKECQAACADNKDKDGQSLTLEKPCSSIALRGKSCQLGTTTLGKIGDLRPSADSTYLMVQCFDEKLVTECPNNFVYAPKHVLVGFAKSVVTASSEQECVEKCLTSTESLGFYCKSGMYYYEDQNENCILNTESRSSQPNVYTEEDAAVVYFELGCGKNGRRLAQKFRKSFSQALFDIPAAGLWTAWSPCQGRMGTSIRYRTCREKDVRNCPKEERNCSHSPDRTPLPGKPAPAGRFPDDELRKRKDHPSLKRQ